MYYSKRTDGLNSMCVLFPCEDSYFQRKKGVSWKRGNVLNGELR